MRCQFLLCPVTAGWLVIAAASSASASAIAPNVQLTPDSVLAVGQVVRLRLENTRFLEGTVVETAPDTVTVRRSGADLRIARAEITDIWIREPAYRGGARRGAVIGGLLFGLAGASLSVGLCDAAECAVDAGATMAGVMIGTVMGIITGGVVGTFADEWVHRYP